MRSVEICVNVYGEDIFIDLYPVVCVGEQSQVLFPFCVMEASFFSVLFVNCSFL